MFNFTMNSRNQTQLKSFVLCDWKVKLYDTSNTQISYFALSLKTGYLCFFQATSLCGGLQLWCYSQHTLQPESPVCFQTCQLGRVKMPPLSREMHAILFGWNIQSAGGVQDCFRERCQTGGYASVFIPGLAATSWRLTSCRLNSCQSVWKCVNNFSETGNWNQSSKLACKHNLCRDKSSALSSQDSLASRHKVRLRFSCLCLKKWNWIIAHRDAWCTFLKKFS